MASCCFITGRVKSAWATCSLAGGSAATLRAGATWWYSMQLQVQMWSGCRPLRCNYSVAAVQFFCDVILIVMHCCALCFRRSVVPPRCGFNAVSCNCSPIAVRRGALAGRSYCFTLLLRFVLVSLFFHTLSCWGELQSNRRPAAVICIARLWLKASAVISEVKHDRVPHLSHDHAPFLH